MLRERASLLSRFAVLTGACVALPSALACLDHPLKPVEYEAAQEIKDSIALTVNKDVDILFIIDDSGSMGEEQATLAQNFSAFINVLEEEGVEANYRIGVTTTDNGHIWCSGTNPAGGKLLLSSCRSRTQDFIFMGAQTVDATQEACLDVCREDLDTIAIQPTTTHLDDTARPRPWLESIEGVTNLPDGVSTVEAFQCLGPQGISGCGFEQPLESMYKALKRAEVSTEDQYGFLRPNAILAVVIVSDEVDCSHKAPDHDSIFHPDGDRTFWSDPDAQWPDSAVCWHGAVECTGSGTPYDNCQSADLDPQGNPTSPNDAVFRPVSRYTELIRGIEAQKQELNPGQEILVAGILGVNSDGSVSYSDSLTHEQFQTEFGMGPGCSSANGQAVPPVRMREFAEEFQRGDDQNLFSICDEDYSPALRAVAEAIADQIRPACMPACVADVDPSTPELDASCVLEQEAPSSAGVVRTTIPECDADGELPGDADVCYVALSDGDRSEYCIEEGWNLEFRLVRGAPAPGGTAVSATCELSQQANVDCAPGQ